MASFDVRSMYTYIKLGLVKKALDKRLGRLNSPVPTDLFRKAVILGGVQTQGPDVCGTRIYTERVRNHQGRH